MRPPNSPDTITDETRDSHNTFDTKFWDSFDVMLSCVFRWSQYLRVLRLSCLSCSMFVIMVITSTQTDRQSISRVCSSMNLNSRKGLRGIAARKLRHIRPHRNFMLSGVLWCLSSIILNHESMMCVCPLTYRNGSFETPRESIMMCVFIHYESIINEWWILNRQSSIISPWLLW
jgi:hypothetical protein